MKNIVLYLLLALVSFPVLADETVVVGGALAPAHGGVPPGGTTDQVIKKNSSADYDVSWGAPSGVSSTTATKITTITANTTLTAANQTILCNAAGGSVTITLPSAASVCDSDVCSVFDVKKIDSTVNSCTVVVSGGALIDGSATSFMTAQYEARTYQSNGTQYWHK